MTLTDIVTEAYKAEKHVTVVCIGVQNLLNNLPALVNTIHKLSRIISPQFNVLQNENHKQVELLFLTS